MRLCHLRFVLSLLKHFMLSINIRCKVCHAFFSKKMPQLSQSKMPRKSYALNWWKGKPSGSIDCTRKQQPRFYWSFSLVVINDTTPLTPLAHERNSIFKCKQHTCTLHDPWGPEKYMTMFKKCIDFFLFYHCSWFCFEHMRLVLLSSIT